MPVSSFCAFGLVKLCGRQDFDVFSSNSDCKFEVQSRFERKLVGQNFEVKPLAYYMESPWNSLNRQPMVEWLSHSQSQEDKQRLTMIGNQVVPRMCSLAYDLLIRMRRQEAA